MLKCGITLFRMFTSAFYLILALMRLDFLRAHVPVFPAGHSKLSSAHEFHDVVGKSWAVYADVVPDGVEYYTLHLNQGQHFELSLITTTHQLDSAVSMAVAIWPANALETTASNISSFIPVQPAGRMLLHGEEVNGANSQNEAASGIPVPGALDEILKASADNALILSGSANRSNLSYEPFGPSAYRRLGRFTVTCKQDAEITIAVFMLNSASGRYGIGLGKKERFSAEELLTLSFTLIRVYLWERQHAGIVLLPFLLTSLGGYFGLLAISVLRHRPVHLARWPCCFGALMDAGVGIGFLVQASWCARETDVGIGGVSVVLGSIHVVAGVLFTLAACGALLVSDDEAAKRLSLPPSALLCVTSAGWGAISAFVWGPYIAGSVLLMTPGIAAVMAPLLKRYRSRWICPAEKTVCGKCLATGDMPEEYKAEEAVIIGVDTE
eukprot:gnl/MRDRNA2_/MRDRNA2_85720_c0_seq1.p1 gnl/MRDRNA2_/MRDRNA2_85720_c0~~gnl/MRDRNA2_/MRDRNA2_85720_c0_seq1.p1  ORF type:complete len:439 (-),score=56.07 gnl/MRDRNA2_/MRDRNA2_85720_c0_seq1:408-1724(-)